MKLLDPVIESSIKIHTVPHQSWQQANLRLSKTMQDEATRQIKEKFDLGILEFSQDSYRSRYFLVAKKKFDSWWFINNIQSLNKVIIREVDISLAINEFSLIFIFKRFYCFTDCCLRQKLWQYFSYKKKEKEFNPINGLQIENWTKYFFAL